MGMKMFPSVWVLEEKIDPRFRYPQYVTIVIERNLSTYKTRYRVRFIVNDKKQWSAIANDLHTALLRAKEMIEPLDYRYYENIHYTKEEIDDLIIWAKASPIYGKGKR